MLEGIGVVDGVEVSKLVIVLITVGMGEPGGEGVSEGVLVGVSVAVGGSIKAMRSRA